VKSQAEQVVAQSSKHRVGVDEALDAGPAHLALQLLDVETAGVEQRRCRTSRDVIAQKSEDIDEDGQTERDDKGARAVVELILGWRYTGRGKGH
jgi:hypothetical protein